jgi:hypothetical protein
MYVNERTEHVFRPRLAGPPSTGLLPTVRVRDPGSLKRLHQVLHIARATFGGGHGCKQLCFQRMFECAAGMCGPIIGRGEP